MKRRISALILVFLIIFSTGYPVYSAGTDEGYREDQTSLGQFVDSFETSGNISVTVDVIRNSTLEVMELNSTTAPPFLNISAFVETDPANRYSQTDTVSTWEGIRRGDTDSRLVGDMGVDYFTDSFSLYFELNITDAEAGDASWRTYILIFALMNHATNYDDNRHIHIWANQKQTAPADDAVYEILFHCKTTAGVADSDTSIQMDVGTNYFMNLTRFNGGDNVTLTIRTGSHEGAIHDTLDTFIETFGWQNLRYIFTPAMKINLNDPNDETSGTVSRISETLGVGYFSSGYFTTVDYLSDPLANGSALTVLVNTSIPANTDIQLQISNDNATWRDHEGVIGDSEDLLGGFEAIDLRDLNYSGNIYFRGNLSTTDPAVTPRFNQIRLITTIGTGGITVNQTINLLNGTWIHYNLSAIEIVVGVHDAGTLASTYFIDADVWMCSEVAGVPGYQINFNATGIDTEAISIYAEIWMYYDGANNHVINVDFWNFTSLAWVTLGQIPDMVGYEWQNHTIWGLHDPVHFLNSSGAIVGRLRHVSNGNINDDIWIESFQILAFVPTGLAAAGAAEEFQFVWIVLAIALMLIGILISKMWFEEGDP